MGVTGLWNVVHPCARPIKIETLNKKRLAVDASIWIYQFLKAVRDKEGNALRNSHVVGFFRRICKLLYLGIKPVFVFDGGAPALKRQTINNRKRRREGRRDDAVQTAGKLLALQMQRIAEEEEQKRKDAVNNNGTVEEELLPENLVYAEEIEMTPQERQKNRKFKKKDAYHLPELDASLAEMGQPNDPRIMSLEELQHYANQFQTGEDINVYDFSKIDFDSPFFTSLPAGDRYNILNAARLRSRLRMGHSKEQLDAMFPNRMEFSRFQIDRVSERNNLTQRLMHINGAEGDMAYGANGTSRVAGEKGREYVLVKNDGVEGGWALGVVSSEGKKEKPIDVDAMDKVEDEEVDSDEDMEFEDVPIEGVNRLPKLPSRPVNDSLRRDAARRQALYRTRNKRTKKTKPDDPDSLFVAPESEEEEWEDVPIDIPVADQEGDALMADEDEDLQKAIAMSMQHNDTGEEIDDTDDFTEVFQQTRAKEIRPFTNGSGKSIAHVANAQSSKVLPVKYPEEDSDEEMSLQAALAESRKSKYKPKLRAAVDLSVQPGSPSRTALTAGFDGPLPFEKLNLGSSLLGKKKMKQIEDDQAGGFERANETPAKKLESRPLPPWFSGGLEEGLIKQKELEERQRELDKKAAQREATERIFEFDRQETLRKSDGPEVIDLEAKLSQSQEVIEIASESGSEAEVVLEATQNARSPTPDFSRAPTMDELVEDIRAEPPAPDPAKEVDVTLPAPHVEMEFDDIDDQPDAGSRQPSPGEQLEWEDSDHEAELAIKSPAVQSKTLESEVSAEADSEEEDFEDVVIDEAPVAPVVKAPDMPTASSAVVAQRSPTAENPVDIINAHSEIINLENEPDDQYSDPEDEELFRQLFQEEEEHARFASTLNNRSVQQNIADYEKELKQLRNQQKKDRRDADEVTQTMITECQQLLALFGLPYITAPMEAEAQCAELVKLGLVDGIVTDDSDVFLFGGTRVYKNVFNQAKFVECYLVSDLESEFGLTRQRLICIAQLLGSDYTEGLPGIGPVTALEILSEFDDLTSFKEWWTKVQANQIPKTEDAAHPFRKKFRRNTTKIFLPQTFPDPRVAQAYLQPEVDNDPSEFQWGVPDLSALRSFLMSTIGWTIERTDEVLVPVIKDMNMRQKEGTQANITAFFGGGVGAGAFAPRVRGEGGSRRLESALSRIGERAGNVPEVGGTSSLKDTSTGAAKDVATQKQKGGKRVAHSDNSEPEGEHDFVEPRKKVKRGARKSKTKSTLGEV